MLTYLFAVYLRTCLQYTYVLICSILTYLYAVYLRIYLQYTYVLICSILFRNKMWCVSIIINFYCSTHPSLTPEFWKKLWHIFFYCRYGLDCCLLRHARGAVMDGFCGDCRVRGAWLIPIISGGKLCYKLLRSRSRFYFIWVRSRILF